MAVIGLFTGILIALAAFGRRSTTLLVTAVLITACGVAGMIAGGVLILKPADSVRRNIVQALDLLDIAYEHTNDQLHISSTGTLAQIKDAGRATLLRFPKGGGGERSRYLRSTLIKFARRG